MPVLLHPLPGGVELLSSTVSYPARYQGLASPTWRGGGTRGIVLKAGLRSRVVSAVLNHLGAA